MIPRLDAYTIFYVKFESEVEYENLLKIRDFSCTPKKKAFGKCLFEEVVAKQ